MAFTINSGKTIDDQFFCVADRGLCRVINKVHTFDGDLSRFTDSISLCAIACFVTVSQQRRKLQEKIMTEAEFSVYPMA
jgi:hypothetical protein